MEMGTAQGLVLYTAGVPYKPVFTVESLQSVGAERAQADDERQGATLATLRLAPSLGLIDVVRNGFRCQLPCASAPMSSNFPKICTNLRRSSCEGHRGKMEGVQALLVTPLGSQFRSLHDIKSSVVCNWTSGDAPDIWRGWSTRAALFTHTPGCNEQVSSEAIER